MAFCGLLFDHLSSPFGKSNRVTPFLKYRYVDRTNMIKPMIGIIFFIFFLMSIYLSDAVAGIAIADISTGEVSAT